MTEGYLPGLSFDRLQIFHKKLKRSAVAIRADTGSAGTGA